MPHHFSDASFHPLPGDEPLNDEQRINAAIAYMNEAALRAAQLFGVAVIVPAAVGADHTEEKYDLRDTEDTAMVSLFFGRLSFLKHVDSVDSAGLFAPLTPKDADLMREAAHMSRYPTRVGRLCFAGTRFYVYRGFDRVNNALLMQDAFSRQILRFKTSLARDGHPEPDVMGGVTLSTLSGQVGTSLSGLRILSQSDDFTIRTLMKVAGQAYFTPEGTVHYTRHQMLMAEAGPLSEAIALTPDFHEIPPWELDRWLSADYLPKKVKPEAGSPLKPVRTETTVTENADGTHTSERREVAEEGERPLTSASPRGLVWDLSAPGGDLSAGIVATRNPDGTLSLDTETGLAFPSTVTERVRANTLNVQRIPRTGTLQRTQEGADLATMANIGPMLGRAVMHPSVWFVVSLPDRQVNCWRVNRSDAAQEAGVLGQPWRILEAHRWSLMRTGLRLYPRFPMDTYGNGDGPRAMMGIADVMPRYSVRQTHGPDDQVPLFYYSSADMDAYTDALPQVEFTCTSMSYERVHELADSCERNPDSVEARAVLNAFAFYINGRVSSEPIRTLGNMVVENIIRQFAQGSRFSVGVWRTWIGALAHLPMTNEEVGRLIMSWEAQGMHQDPISQAIRALSDTFMGHVGTPLSFAELSAEYNIRVLQRHVSTVSPDVPHAMQVRGLIENGVVMGSFFRGARGEARARESRRHTPGLGTTIVTDLSADGDEEPEPEEDSSITLPAGAFPVGRIDLSGGGNERQRTIGEFINDGTVRDMALDLIAQREAYNIVEDANPGVLFSGPVLTGTIEARFPTAVLETRLDDVGSGTPLRGATRIAGFLDEVHPPIALETVTLTAGANLPYEVITYEPMTERQAAEATQRLVGFGFTDDAAEDAADALSDNYGNPAGLLEDLARVEEARDLGNVTNEQIREAVCADMTADDLSEYEVGPWTQFLDENGLIPFPQEHLHAGAQEAAEALPGGRGPVTPQTQDPAHRAALSDLLDAAGRAMADLGEGALLTETQLRTFGNVLSDVLESDAGGWASGQTCPNCGDGTLMVHHGDEGTIVECQECQRDPRRGPADLEAEIRAAGQRLADRLAAQRGSD